MNRNLAALVAMLVFTAGLAAYTYAGGEMALDWYSIDGGGGRSSGGGYVLSGSIGQHDAGTLSGGSYSVEGGFWSGMVEPTATVDSRSVYLPVVLR
jgi:hypothetical protein